MSRLNACFSPFQNKTEHRLLPSRVHTGDNVCVHGSGRSVCLHLYQAPGVEADHVHVEQRAGQPQGSADPPVMGSRGPARLECRHGLPRAISQMLGRGGWPRGACGGSELVVRGLGLGAWRVPLCSLRPCVAPGGRWEPDREGRAKCTERSPEVLQTPSVGPGLLF